MALACIPLTVIFPWLRYFYFARWLLGWLLYLFIDLPILTIFTIVLIPYGLFFFSANFSMRPADMGPVQTYLDHFESLFPDLIASVATTHEQRAGYGIPWDILFWPRKATEDAGLLSLVKSAMKKAHTFSDAAGLFAQLEANRVCDRKVLWSFLRDKVEEAGLVNDNEIKAFAAVMDKMCSHQTRDIIERFMPWRKPSSSVPKAKKPEEEQQQPKRAPLPEGMPIVQATRESIDWILQKGAIVVPSETFHLYGLHLFEMWGAFLKDADLEKGFGDYWQIIDLRKPPKPWEVKE